MADVKRSGRAAPARTLYLIDTPGFIFRAFHALPPLTTSRGLPTGAVYGFCNMLLKLFDEHRPDYVAAVFDCGRPFRHDIYDGYKANRAPRPPELTVQLPLVRRALNAFRVCIVEQETFEADDLIATFVARARAADLDVVVVSSDKDLMQLASEHVQLLDTMKDVRFGPAEVFEKFGVRPDQLGDWLALVGDSSDNIPGVTGVGAKTASKLLGEWGSLERILAAAAQIPSKRLRENLVVEADQARLSRRLVELRSDCPLPVELEDLRRMEPDSAQLWELFGELEFGRLRQRIAPESRLERDGYETVCSTERLVAVAGEVRRAGRLALAVQTTNGQTRAPLVGLALAWGAGAAAYVPLGHSYLGVARQLELVEVARVLSPLLADPALPLVCFDGKAAQVVLELAGLPARVPTQDPMLTSYVIDPSRDHTIGALALDRLGHRMLEDEQRGGRRAGFGELDIEQATRLVGERAEVTLALAEALERALSGQAELERLLHQIELPLSRVLAQIELVGCLVDCAALRALSLELAGELERLEREIQRDAGWAVNVGSPKQLQQLLFEQLGLSRGRKIKTGFSTDADVLADLALEHPIAARINEHRALAKLKSTYLDALPTLVDRRSGRLHTSFNQAVAATGRLSSSEPNLQNIPVRTELGRRIRAAFIAPPGRVLLAADYSQVELRILAHLSADPVLVDAFQRGQDVHARTAAEVFGVDPDGVTDDQRRVAKAVNFGVIYGQSDFGLSRQLRIPRARARAYIDNYFERYAGVRMFMERVIAEARETGAVRTLFGRRRPVPDILSRRYQARSAAERVARNTPIQGTAADLLKLAMLRVAEALEREAIDAQMILTVHDELVLEVAEDHAERAANEVRDAMAQAVALTVPLKVDVSWGRTWT